MLETILIATGVILVATAVTWAGSALLERAADDLAMHYRLPDVVQGTIVVAIGSSFPELSTTVISTAIHGEFELGMSAIVGSAIFNILVIPALSGIAGGRLAGSRQLVYKDALFYLTSVAVLLLAFSFALIYNPRPDGELVGVLDRPIAACPLLLYAVYIFLQQQETEEHWQQDRAATEPSKSVGKSWLLLLAGLVLIVAGVEALLRSVIALGDTLGTPTFLWGATVVAAATSLPDAIISIRTARQGEAEVSLGNVLGSNIFDLLVAIPAGVLIAGATLVDYGVAAPLMAALTVATIVLFAALRTELTLTRRECYILLSLYILFIGWLVLETIGITTWLR